MKKSHLAALAASFALSTAVPANAATIMFASVADFEPYNYLDDEGVLQGFEADLATLICERAGLTCDWTLAPWDDLIPDLLAGDFDVIMTGMQITIDREIYIDFSDEYFPADPSAIMTLDGGSYPSAFGVVGAQSSSLQASYVNAQGWTVSEFSDPADALQALISGEITAYVSDQANLEALMTDYPGTYSLVATEIVIGGGVGLGVAQSSSLRTTLNTALASLKADGTLDSLIGTWFDGRDPNYRQAQ